MNCLFKEFDLFNPILVRFKLFNIMAILYFYLSNATNHTFISFLVFEWEHLQKIILYFFQILTKKIFLTHYWANNLKTIDLSETHKLRIILLWILKHKYLTKVWFMKNFSCRHCWQIFHLKNSFFTAIFLFINRFLYTLQHILYFA